MAVKKRTVKKSAAKKSVRRKSPVAKKAAPKRRRTTKRVAKFDVKDVLINAGVAVAGAIVAGKLIGMYKPTKPNPMIEKILPFAPMIAGVGVSMLPIASKNPMVRGAASGMVVVGAYNALKRVAPQIGLAGDDGSFVIPTQLEEAAMLGFDAGSNAAELGIEAQLGDEDELGIEAQLGDDNGVEDLLGDDETESFGADYEESSWNTSASTI